MRNTGSSGWTWRGLDISVGLLNNTGMADVHIWEKLVYCYSNRLLRELRDKYLKAGGNFELPAETRKKMGVSKLSKLSMEHLDTIQSVLTEGLKNYWYVN